MFKRILFAHNATPAAERALLYLEHLARLENAEVIVLHVYQLPERYMATQGYALLVEQLELVAQEVVNDTVEYLQKAGISAVGIIHAGVPARAILETAQEEKVSLIVLGTRGPSSMTDILLGDVSTEVLRHANCPVFLVP
ncbi:MAG TPA: universal stress protein [Anaerolineae bacterium]|nr:universal stress protein [Anaerolineae bacterium]HQH38343.1 universal stress protein [Anaerolineae bacterium]